MHNSSPTNFEDKPRRLKTEKIMLNNNNFNKNFYL